MKNLATGELSGEPLPHDEWLKEQGRLQAEAEKARTTKTTTKSDTNHAPKPKGDK